MTARPKLTDANEPKRRAKLAVEKIKAAGDLKYPLWVYLTAKRSRRPRRAVP